MYCLCFLPVVFGILFQTRHKCERHAKGTFATTTVYFLVEYNGIVKLPGEEYMTTSGGEIRGDSKFEVIWDSTKGYMDGTQMYADLVTSKRENYTYEMSEGLKQFGD